MYFLIGNQYTEEGALNAGQLQFLIMINLHIQVSCIVHLSGGVLVLVLSYLSSHFADHLLCLGFSVMFCKSRCLTTWYYGFVFFDHHSVLCYRPNSSGFITIIACCVITFFPCSTFISNQVNILSSSIQVLLVVIPSCNIFTYLKCSYQNYQAYTPWKWWR